MIVPQSSNKHEITWLWGDSNPDLKVLRMCWENFKKALKNCSEMCEKVQENVKIVLKKLLERCRKCWKSPKVSGHFPLTSWFKVTDRLLLETCDPFFTIYEKANKLWIYELPKLFLNYAWDRPEILLEFSWDISEIDLRNKSDMLDICLKFARELSEICLINMCNLHEICLRYAIDMA